MELVRVGMVVVFSGLKAGTAVILRSVKKLKDKKKLVLFLTVPSVDFNIRIPHSPWHKGLRAEAMHNIFEI